MKIIKVGQANRHDLIHVTCQHCGSNVTFWRDEPGTRLNYCGTYNDGERYLVYWKCPVCEVPEEKELHSIDPVYEDLGRMTIEGIEKGRVLTPEEKAEMEEALLIDEE